MKKLLKPYVNYIRANPLLGFVLIYIFVRLLIFNINVAEWGDTYRMVRAAEFLSHGSWPWDEKRWPFFSVLLIPGVYVNAPVLWGKFVVLASSVITLMYQYKFYLRFVQNNNRNAILSLVFTALSPVFAYWSFRVMADPVFTMLVIVFFYFLFLWREKLNGYNVSLLSVLLLCITMTRLEGLFVLFGASVYLLIGKKIKELLIIGLPQIVIYLPFTLYAKVLYQGEVHNDYLQEFSGFVFDLDRFLYFAAYYLFFLGVPFALFFVVKGAYGVFNRRYFLWPLYTFLGLLTILGFVWTPSLPRILMPMIPFLTIFFIYGIKGLNIRRVDIAVCFILTVLLAGLQYNLKLYFLNLSYIGFGVVLLATFFYLAYLSWSKTPKYLIYYLILVLGINSIVVVANQRNDYKTIYEAAMVAKNVDGTVGYSDESGVTAYFLAYNGVYLDRNKYRSLMPHSAQWEWVIENEVEYIITTNGFETNSRLDLHKSGGHLAKMELIFESVYTVRDVFDRYLVDMGVIDRDEFEFETQVWKVKEY